MHGNSTIITINKTRYVTLFKEFLTFKSVELSVSHIDSFQLWLNESVQRYLNNALLPSGEQYRLFNNVGSEQYAEILLFPDHEDITTTLFSTLVSLGVKITGEYHTQVAVYLEWLMEDLKCYLKGKSPYMTYQLMYCTDNQITYRQQITGVDVSTLTESNQLSLEMLQNRELMQRYLHQFGPEELANQIEILNAAYTFNY